MALFTFHIMLQKVMFKFRTILRMIYRTRVLR